MDLRHYGRVLHRFRWLLLAGLIAAFALSFLSYVQVGFSASGFSFKHRDAELWDSIGSLVLVQARTDDKQPIATTDDLRFTNLAPIYARLASGQDVRSRAERSGKRLPGRFFAEPVVDPVPLPLLTTHGQGETAEAAEATLRQGTAAFISVVREQQAKLGIPRARRIDVAVLTAPSPATVLAPRRKTLPVFVFLAVLCAAIALAFVLENSMPRSRQEPALGGAVVEPEASVLAARADDRHQAWPATHPRLGSADGDGAQHGPAHSVPTRLESTDEEDETAESEPFPASPPEVDELARTRRWA